MERKASFLGAPSGAEVGQKTAYFTGNVHDPTRLYKQSALSPGPF